MALTNPNKLVNVQELNYFEGKIGAKYAEKSELPTVASSSTCRDIINELI